MLILSLEAYANFISIYKHSVSHPLSSDMWTLGIYGVVFNNEAFCILLDVENCTRNCSQYFNVHKVKLCIPKCFKFDYCIWLDTRFKVLKSITHTVKIPVSFIFLNLKSPNRLVSQRESALKQHFEFSLAGMKELARVSKPLWLEQVTCCTRNV